jgi:tape measure domain-containing protein
MLGDTAGGNAQKLDSITRGFMKSMLKGKVDMESLNMIAEAGVPIYSELADSMGVTVQEMMDMSRKGSITSDDLTRAFKKMTNEGGIFYKGMDIASKTLSGKLSTLKDNISLTAAEIGTQLLPTIKPLIDRMIEVAGRMREWVSANSELINQKINGFINSVAGAAKTLVALWNSGLIPGVLAAVTAYKALTGAMAAYKTISAVVKGAQIALNVAMAANPIGLVIAAVAALIGVLVLLEKKFKIVTKAWEGLKRIGGAVKDFFGGDERTGYSGGLVSANQGMIESRSYSENRSTVDVNLNNLPPGSTARQRGRAPGVNLNYGFQGGM